MNCQLPSKGKVLATIIAPVRPLYGVTPHVQRQIAKIAYLMTTNPTLPRLVLEMISHVFIQDHPGNILVTTFPTARIGKVPCATSCVYSENTKYQTQSTTTQICISKQYISNKKMTQPSRVSLSHFTLEAACFLRRAMVRLATVSSLATS